MSDVFGSLLDWGHVMEQIVDLKNAGKLDEHQDGLSRILRYPRQLAVAGDRPRMCQGLERAVGGDRS